MQRNTNDKADIIKDIASIPNIEKLNDSDVENLINEIRQALSVK